MTALLTGLVTLLVFGSVILVHELGHFLAARHCGIHVEEFSIGFGPKIFQRRRGSTTFLGMLAVLAICFFASVQRYYKLLGEQGYLMLALPVHAWQHIAAKLICGVVWTLFGFFYFGICGTLTLSALDGDSFSLTGVNIQDVPLLLLFFLLILALIAGAQLHAYLACAYAGMFTQHRLTISIISYFVIGFIGQMLSLVGTIVFAIKVYPFLDNIGSMVELQNSILLSICVIFLLTLLVDALLWALTQWLMSSRLNLA